MRDDLDALAAWQDETGVIVLATVVATSGSAPFVPGATLALHPDGRVRGGVSGGCVESAVVTAAAETLASGRAQRLPYGVSDGRALAAGLTCGGRLEVLVRRVRVEDVPLAELAALVAAEVPAALVTVAAHADRPDLVGTSVAVTAERTLGGGPAAAPLAAGLVRLGRAVLRGGDPALVHMGASGEELGTAVTAFVQPLLPRPRLVLVGAGDHAAALTRVGRTLGLHVTVCDPRATFTTTERLPEADDVTVGWPHHLLPTLGLTDRDAVCVLTHDPRIDVPALTAALAGPTGFVGAMGSRRTHADRLERLRAAGVAAADLARLHSPIGLDLGARTPQEIAVAVAAELVLWRHGGTGRPLHRTDGPIHAPVSRTTAVAP